MFDLGPPALALLSHSPTPYVVLMLAGFAIAIFGHLGRFRWVIAAGIALIVLGAFLLPLAANISSENKPPPVEEALPEEE